MKKLRLSKLDIIGIVLIVLFLPVIIINFTLVVKGMVNPDKVPTVFGGAPLIVISDSMTIDKEAGTGAFNKNDLIIIQTVDPDELAVDDIITYMTKEGDIVTHRIIGILSKEEARIASGFTYNEGEKIFETRGDANNGQVDYYGVTYEQIIGKYSFRVPNVGGIAMFIQSPVGVVVLLGIPILVIVGLDLIKKTQEKKQSDSKQAELEAEIARLKAQQSDSNESEE